MEIEVQVKLIEIAWNAVRVGDLGPAPGQQHLEFLDGLTENFGRTYKKMCEAVNQANSSQ